MGAPLEQKQKPKINKLQRKPSLMRQRSTQDTSPVGRKALLFTLTLGLALAMQLHPNVTSSASSVSNSAKNWCGKGPAWREVTGAEVRNTRHYAVMTLIDRFADAQETDAGRPMIARSTFTVANPGGADITIPANSTGYVQKITSDGFVLCDFDEFPVIRLSAEDAVDVACLERRTRLQILIHADKESRPHHRVWGLSKNIALKNVPVVKSMITEPARIARDVCKGEMGFKHAAHAAVTKSIVPLAGEVATVATLCGTGGSSALVVGARGISMGAAATGAVADVATGKPSYSTLQSAVGAINPGMSTVMSLGKNGVNVGSQARRAIMDPNAPGVDVLDLGRLALDSAAVGRLAAAKVEQNRIDQQAQDRLNELAPPENAVAGESTFAKGFDRETPFYKYNCTADDRSCHMDQALAQCHQRGYIGVGFHDDGFHAPLAAKIEGTDKYECVVYDYGKPTSTAESMNVPHSAPKEVSMDDLKTAASMAANVGAYGATATPASAETGSDAPNDVYVQMTGYGPKLPIGQTKASMLEYLNERQRAEETNAASWWQRAIGNVPRKAAQKLASCDNIDQNCLPDAPVELVRTLDTGRSDLDTWAQSDALYAAGLLKQLTFIRLGWGDTTQSDKFMAQRYPGVPIRNIRYTMSGNFEEL